MGAVHVCSHRAHSAGALREVRSGVHHMLHGPVTGSAQRFQMIRACLGACLATDALCERCMAACSGCASFLQVSRCIGDFDYKGRGLTAEPEVTHTRLTSTDGVLVLGSDGLWDCISNEEAVSRQTGAGTARKRTSEARPHGVACRECQPR